MARRNQKTGRKKFWLDNLPSDTFAICPTCTETKPISEFWWEKQYKMGKVCSGCQDKKVKPSGYADYIKSEAWREKRLEYWRSKKMRECYVCSDPWLDFKGKELHHRTYERLGNENLDDLVPVCPGHHDLITAAWNEEKLLPYPERRSLWEVTDYVASCYAEEQYIIKLDGKKI